MYKQIKTENGIRLNGMDPCDPLITMEDEHGYRLQVLTDGGKVSVWVSRPDDKLGRFYKLMTHFPFEVIGEMAEWLFNMEKGE